MGRSVGLHGPAFPQEQRVTDKRRQRRAAAGVTLRGAPSGLRLPALTEVQDRLATPDALAVLHAYEDDTVEPLDRFAAPREVKAARKNFRLVPASSAELLPIVDPPAPSPALRRETQSLAYSHIEKVMPRMQGVLTASWPGRFDTSIPRIGLPLEAAVVRGELPRTDARIGDQLHRARTHSDLHSSSANLNASLRHSSSVGSLRSSVSGPAYLSKRASDSRYCGRALSVSGGAPLSPGVDFGLTRLQVEQLTKSASRMGTSIMW